MAIAVFVTIGIILAVVFALILASGIRVIRPYEQALYTWLGKYRRTLNSGLNYVIPFGTRVYRVDLRTQTWDVPRQEVITRDNSPTNVDAVIYARVMEPRKAVFEVNDFRVATVALAQTTLRSIIGDMDLDQTLNSRENINTQLRQILDEATEGWGIKVESVEIREVDPVARVKEAMEKQTSAERERRATILAAEGEKKSAILRAEGEKESAVLRAQGEAQASILSAEGAKTAEILRRQGEAQGLQTLSVGAASLGAEALSVLGFNALQEMGKGASTKFVVPMDLVNLARHAAHAMGGDGTPYQPSDVQRLEAILGKDMRKLLEGGEAVKVLAEAKKTAEQATRSAQEELAGAQTKS